MSSRFNTFLHGNPDDVADILSGDDSRPVDDTEVRAILTNLCRRMVQLEARLAYKKDIGS